LVAWAAADMSASITVGSIYQGLVQRLHLQWVAGQDLVGRALAADSEAVGEALVGHLNPVRLHPVSVVGRSELAYLSRLSPEELARLMEDLAAHGAGVVVVADGQPPPPALQCAAIAHAVALVTSTVPSHQLIREMQYFVDNHTTPALVMHGVLMEVFGIGVLLTGEAGVGKSELALELISRGHRLVADDAPEFRRAAPDTISGTCPETLRNFMEVRGLGVLNIRALFGDSAVKYEQTLRFMVRLEPMNERQLRTIDRLDGNRTTACVLGVLIPRVTLPVAAGRDLAVLLETAVRNQILSFKGYDAGAHFSQIQMAHMERQGR
jgi:HPr kinase/phosphorylase